MNARAAVDAEGFGGHTPLFNAVVNGPWADTGTVSALLARGADPAWRASLEEIPRLAGAAWLAHRSKRHRGGMEPWISGAEFRHTGRVGKTELNPRR